MPCCIILTELDVVVMLCGACKIPWINKPAHISADGRMISHFELYFDLVLVRLHELPSPLAYITFIPHPVPTQVGCFLHIGGLMNLDFGKVLKDGDVTAGAKISTTETLPGIFGTVPNFTAAVIFFIALWNSWCVTERAQHSCHRHSHTRLSQVHVRELHGSFPVLRRCHHPALFHFLPRGPRDGHRHRPVRACVRLAAAAPHTSFQIPASTRRLATASATCSFLLEGTCLS